MKSNLKIVAVTVAFALSAIASAAPVHAAQDAPLEMKQAWTQITHQAGFHAIGAPATRVPSGGYLGGILPKPYRYVMVQSFSWTQLRRQAGFHTVTAPATRIPGSGYLSHILPK